MPAANMEFEVHFWAAPGGIYELKELEAKVMQRVPQINEYVWLGIGLKSKAYRVHTVANELFTGRYSVVLVEDEDAHPMYGNELELAPLV